MRNTKTEMYQSVDITESYMLNFLMKYADGLDRKWVDIENLSKDFMKLMPLKMIKNDLYNFVADSCVQRANTHPDFNILASRICVSRLHQTTHDDILDVATELYQNCDKDGNHYPLISTKTLEIIEKNHQKIQTAIQIKRDYYFDYFGLKTLERSYLLKNYDRNTKERKIVERPQFLIMRVAIGIHEDDLDSVFETYDLISERYFTHATPTLFNSGTNRPQLSSCFLVPVDDDLKSMYKQVLQMAEISKWAGGIGVHLSSIRGRNSVIRGTNGISEGVLPYCIVLNKLSRHVNQGGKRPGSIACYIEPWHCDIFEFCELRKTNTGSDDTRARDLFLALWIPNLFMQRVENDDVWSLMCPDECPNLNKTYGAEFEKLYLTYEKQKKYKRQIKAIDLWKHIIECQSETGFPYMLYKDHCNEKSNQKNLGTIRSSNLCVHGETKILTDDGYQIISDLVDKNVNVWNGEEWSQVTIKQTGTNKDLIRISLSNGTYLDCTPEHQFYIPDGTQNQNSKKVDAKDLKIDDRMIKWNLPNAIIFKENEEFKYPYTHGFFCGNEITHDDDVETIKYPKIYLYGEKKQLLKNLEYVSYTYVSYTIDENQDDEKQDRYDIVAHQDMAEKFKIPMKSSVETRLKWFAGYCDANGCVVENDSSNVELQICSINENFINEIRLMLHTLGVESKMKIIKTTKTMKTMKYEEENLEWRLLVSSTNMIKLFDLGFEFKYLKFNKYVPNICVEPFVRVISNKPSFQNVNTYCFTEPKRHMGVFNGILTGQCAEIVEYSDGDETAVCNLCSICLPRFIVKNDDGTIEYNYDKLIEVTRVIVRNLNKIIDINYYPVYQAEISNKQHRPIGIGVQGLADVYNIFEYPYDSSEASQLNKMIFETIYYASLDESKELAKKYGPYKTFYNSPFSEGKLQYHLWGTKTNELLTKNKYNWETLINEIMEHGTRNSLLTALMPTAGTSQIMGCYEGFEPYLSNVFVRTTIAGEFLVINDNLIRSLIRENLWDEDMKKLIIIKNGSIQDISKIPQNIRDIYKTAFEIKLKNIISQSVDRGHFIDQSQSMNLFMKKPDFTTLTSAHFYGWKNGIKTGMYYLRTTPAVNPIQFGIDVDDVIRLTKKNNIIDLITDDYKIQMENHKKISKEHDDTVIMCKYDPSKRAEGCMSCGS